MTLEGFQMKEKSVSYELIMDLITNIVKKYIDNNGQATEEGDDKCLNAG
jgi:hypothetical protein